MTNTDPKPQSIREFIASSSNPAFQEQIKAACAERGISLDSPWPLPLTKSAAVAELEQPPAPRRNGRVARPKSSDPAAVPDQKPLSKRQQKKAADAAKIYTTPYTPEDIVYLARQLILCTLPHSDPGNVLSWSRTNGNLTLGIVSGINAKKGVLYGIPYGIIPRLILVWIVTEITRTKSRRLELGNRFADFLLKLGLNPANGTGKCSDARRTREQMDRTYAKQLY